MSASIPTGGLAVQAQGKQVGVAVPVVGGGGGVEYYSDDDVYRTAAAVDAAEKARGVNQVHSVLQVLHVDV